MPELRRRRRRRWSWLLLIVVVALVLLWCGRPRLVLGTFNVRSFPGASTDLRAVAEAFAALDADAIAVQEIVDRGAFAGVLRDAGARTGRRYQAVFLPCRVADHHCGVVYDAELLALDGVQPLVAPDGPLGLVAGLVAPDGRRLALASVHFKAGGKPGDLARRREEWTWLEGQMTKLAAAFAAPLVVAGDINSTGFLEPDSEERRFLDELVARAGARLPTAALACSMYWRTRGRYEVSLLDHVLGPNELSFGAPEALGMCAELACAPQDEAPPAFERVSDHCPVRVTVR